MKLRLRNTGLILGLALLLFSCEDPGTIGIDVDNNNLDFKVFYKKFVLPSTLIQVDSVPVSNSGRILTGSYNDPKFGLSRHIGYTVVLRRLIPNITDDAVFDSLILQLKFDYVHGEEIKSEHTLRVHRLQKTIDDIATYYTFATFDYSEAPIGEITYKYFLNENEEVRLDTLLRIPLSDDLGNELLSKMKDDQDTTFENVNNWLNYFKGVALVSDENDQTVTGFNVRDTDSKMLLYYHFSNPDGEIINRIYDFPTESAVHTTHSEFDRTGTAISSISEFYTDNQASDTFIYIQSGSGLVAKIDFTPFKDFTDTLNNLIINRGDLTIGEIENYPDYMVPPNILILYLTNDTNRRLRGEDGAYKAIQVDNSTVDPAGTLYPIQSKFNSEDLLYTDPVSSFLQALYDGTVTETKALIFPNFDSNSKTVNRFLVDPDKIILEVYYSTTDQNINPD